MIDIQQHVEERNGYQVFVVPEDGKLSLNHVTEWDESETPVGWGPTIKASKGDEIVLGFTTDDD